MSILRHYLILIDELSGKRDANWQLLNDTAIPSSAQTGSVVPGQVKTPQQESRMDGN